MDLFRKSEICWYGPLHLQISCEIWKIGGSRNIGHVFHISCLNLMYLILSIKHIRYRNLLSDNLFLPRLPIQVGKSVSFLVIVEFLAAAAVVGLGWPMIHPQHVEQPSSGGQFNRKYFGLSFGLKNGLIFSFDSDETCLNYPFLNIFLLWGNSRQNSSGFSSRNSSKQGRND